jgi:hypothetical protein
MSTKLINAPGQLVGNFTNYFVPGTTVTQAEFQAEINKQALYIFYLFIAKFVLSYISMVRVLSGSLCFQTDPARIAQCPH